jgi:hypothetical protein
MEHFQENARPRGGGGGIRFSVRKCDNANMLERFLFPDNVKPLQPIMPRLRAAANV